MLKSKLRQKTPPEDHNKTRHGLPEQRKRIDKRLPSKNNTRAMGLKDSVREPGIWTELKMTGTAISGTCTKATNSKMTYSGKNMEDQSCGLTGHFRGSTAGKEKPAEEKAET